MNSKTTKSLKKNVKPTKNSKNVEEIDISPEKRRNTKRIKSSNIKWNTMKYLNY